jgi:hypothetical protein
MRILKQAICILFLAILSFSVKGQSCSSISGKKDKQRGVETVSGITTSKDFYSLMIQKEMNYADTSILPKYLLFLNAASRVQFSDSVLNTTGTFQLRLLDGSFMELEGVSFTNNPLGFCCTLGFKVYVNEDVMQALALNPIISLGVSDMLSTNFEPKKQKEQQKIYTCLLLRKPKL